MTERTLQILWKKMEQLSAFFIGIAMLVFGVALVIIATTIAQGLSPALSWLTELINHLGVGLIAAGAVTATVEPISRKRQQNDIEELKRAHFEAVLKGVMPEPIFSEVQSQIIRQPFLRSNTLITYELSWFNNDRRGVLKHIAVSYDVVNVSKMDEILNVNIYLDKVPGGKYDSYAHIDEVLISPNGVEPITLTAEQLRKMQRTEPNAIEITVPTRLLPKQRAHVEIRGQALIFDQFQNLVFPTPTVGFDVTIVHPDDMTVRGALLHPAKSLFRTEASSPKLKRWIFSGSALPYQGIELAWAPTVEPELSGQ